MTNIKATDLIDGTEKTIVFYDNIENIPIKRYQLLQKYSLIDGGIGSTMGDVVRHFQKFDQFLEVKDMESLSIERENLLMNFGFIINGQSTATYMMGAMIKSIDGKDIEVDDTVIDELVGLLERLDISYDSLAKVVDAQKKSLQSS